MKFRSLAVGLIAACSLLVGAKPAVDLDRETKVDVLDSLTRTLESQAYVPGANFKLIDKYLAEQKAAIDESKTDEDFRQAVSVALDKLGYSHIVLFSPQMVEQRRTSAAVGIGILALYKDHALLIHSVFPGTPADEAGLEPDDQVIEVNGKAPDSIGAMAGSAGTQVTIKVLKYDTNEVQEITLTRRKFNTVEPPTLTWIDKETALLTVPTFDLSYKRNRIEGLFAKAKASKNLVLDLRNNGGGAVSNMSHLLGLLMPDSMPVGTFISKRLVQDYVSATNGDPTDLAKVAAWAPSKVKPGDDKIAPYAGHLAVLIDAESGSAAEIAAEALRENLRAPVIGEKSAGKVLVSVLAELKHGYQLQYPIFDYVSAQGIRLEGHGIVPDVEEKDARVHKAGLPDPPLDAAVALLHKQEIGQVTTPAR